jgi:tetratricopeptide (TPR) repeat protein
MALVREMG